MPLRMRDNLCVVSGEVVERVRAGRVGKASPMVLPIEFPDARSLTPSCEVVGSLTEGGVVFCHGEPVWTWLPGDDAGYRMAAVQLVTTKTASAVSVGSGFGVNELTVRRWRADYLEKGTAGLVPGKRGPKGPSKIDESLRARIVALSDQGVTGVDIASQVGLSRSSVVMVLRDRTATPAEVDDRREVDGGEGVVGGLVPLARPVDRCEERRAARAGLLAGAAPVICEGAGLPLAGALVVLPALEVTGLLDIFDDVYGRDRAAFYSARALVLSLVFAALLGEPRVEGFTRLNPTDVGRLIGLDRAPEPKTFRARIAELAAQDRSGALIEALARTHIAAHRDATGIFYVDGHVRAYHGTADIPKRHVARIRLAMPAEEDVWVTDGNGDGLLVWQADPGSSLVGALAHAVDELRGMVGPTARPTIAFDRGGWSPALFATLTDDEHRFDILTYRKGKTTFEPRSAFTTHTFTDNAGVDHDYLLADRNVRIRWVDKNKKRRLFACRQITRLDPATGHQTQIITSRTDPDPALIAHAMFSRWRQENFFRYMRAHYGLDALDAYDTVGDNPERLVTNPARKQADKQVAAARAELTAAQATEGRTAFNGGRSRADQKELAAAYTAAQAHIDQLATTARNTPAKIRIGDIRPDAARLDPERKRIHDAVRTATYNAESALARTLTTHYRRGNDEARSLIHEIAHTAADMQITGTELHIRIHPLSAPRRTRALQALCHDLNQTDTTYPGTNLTLRYSTHPHP